MTITSFPLHWPEGWKRTKKPKRSRFADHTIKKATDTVLFELKMMGVPDYCVIISTNLKLKNNGLPYSSQKEPDDSGVSVWWRQNIDSNNQMVMAVDDYDSCSDNLWAIAKTLEALRGIERWSSSEIISRTFKGFTALPPGNKSSWRDILLYDGESFAEAQHAYYKQRSRHHPDKGGDPDKFNSVKSAWEECQKYFNEK